MNPEFLTFQNMTKNDFIGSVQQARSLLSRISEDTILIIAQNLGYCEETPQMAELGKRDALTAVTELCCQAERLKDIIVKMQGHVLE